MKLIVIAKLPVAGRVKTRLSPPCTYEQGAALALASLQDTLDAGRAATAFASRHLVIERFGHDVPDALSHGYEVVDQRGAGLDERLANAFAVVGGPAILVGMDTPQLTAAMLDQAAAELSDTEFSDTEFSDTEFSDTELSQCAVLGTAIDGGWWIVGLRQPRRDAFLGVPMSQSDTGQRQLDRLGEIGLRVRHLPQIADLDTWADARAIATAHPHLRTAAAVATVQSQLGKPATAEES